jgi:hypothetical protein
MQQATHRREPEERGMVPEVWWDSGEVESDELEELGRRAART